MKRKTLYVLITAAVCALTLLVFSFIFDFWSQAPEDRVVKVGFVFAEDEITPYTANFFQAQKEMQDSLGDKVQVMTLSNVPSKEAEEPVRELIRKGCDLIIMNDEGSVPSDLAREFPNIQFCQMSSENVSTEGKTANYHTFNGEIYEGRYVSGIAAGMKLRELMDSGAIKPEEAKVGYIAPKVCSEAISGWTAFLLGVHTAAPEAVLQVKYTDSWSSYGREKQCARELIEEGCLVITHHTNTSAAASVCETAAESGKTVYYIGYNQSMMDIAPTAALVSVRINWAPYITGAARAVLTRKEIEKTVPGNVHGRDMSGGFSKGWVDVAEINSSTVAPGTEEAINQAIDQLSRGKLDIFKGNYTGTDPENPGDTIDLKEGYRENKDSSCASFHYILDKYVTVSPVGQKPAR